MQSFATNKELCNNDPFVALSFTLEEPLGWNCRVSVDADRQSAQIRIPVSKDNSRFETVKVNKSDLVNSSQG
jgi:hypothetical protein